MTRTGTFYALTVLLTIGCQTKKDSDVPPSERKQKNALFTTEVGGMIDKATAQRWTQNWQRQHSVAREKEPTSYQLQAGDFQRLIDAQSTIGVYVGNGKDEQGNYRLLLMAVDNEGRIVEQPTVETDAGTTISWQRAQEWKKRWDGAIQGRYWGKNPLNEFLQMDRNTNNIEAINALNNSGEPQLLLTKGSASGGGLDASSICPPVCP